jgi:hypothetical protein
VIFRSGALVAARRSVLDLRFVYNGVVDQPLPLGTVWRLLLRKLLADVAASAMGSSVCLIDLIAFSTSYHAPRFARARIKYAYSVCARKGAGITYRQRHLMMTALTRSL